jgi:hypothetical protein
MNVEFPFVLQLLKFVYPLPQWNMSFRVPRICVPWLSSFLFPHNNLSLTSFVARAVFCSNFCWRIGRGAAYSVSLKENTIFFLMVPPCKDHHEKWPEWKVIGAYISAHIARHLPVQETHADYLSTLTSPVPNEQDMSRFIWMHGGS